MRTLLKPVSTALRALAEHGLRSGLTISGIMIGVGSVVLLVAIGQGVQSDVTHQIDSLGTNLVFVVPGKLDESGQPNPMAMMGISTLTESDISALASVPGVTQVFPLVIVTGSVERGNMEHSAFVLAAPSAVSCMVRSCLVEGRFYTPDEDDQRLCVLADAPRRAMFGRGPAVGRMIDIKGIPFRVVGVLAKDEAPTFGPVTFQSVVFLPYRAALDAFPDAQINRIVAATDYHRKPEPILAEMRRRLLLTHGGHDDFGLVTQKQLLAVVYRVFNIITALVVGISSISLVVAGIGIMNIMLVTVTERAREIGIRKAVGARRRDIFAQFLAEALALSLVGGTAGFALASVICQLVTVYSPIHPLITWQSVALALGVCLAVGVVFGVTPAMRAAAADPIEALRRE